MVIKILGLLHEKACLRSWTVRPQNMARGLKFRVYKVQGFYYLCSKNKGADRELQKNS